MPSVTRAYGKNEKIAIVTADDRTLKPMYRLISRECGVEVEAERFIIVGAQKVKGFDAVAKGEQVDVAAVTPHMVDLCVRTKNENPAIKAFLFECTELPPYSDAVRHATGLPVYDAVTNCDFFIDGFRDNERFGIKDWQKEWDGQQENYKFGSELTESERAKMKTLNDSKEAYLTKDQQIVKHQDDELRESACLGIIRLDYNYEAAPGDVDHPDSYEYDVFYHCVPGLTFEKCMANAPVTGDIKEGFNTAINYLINEKKVSGISGDCGFMMYYQEYVREHPTTNCPVFMSALSQLPAVTCAYGDDERIIIVTANKSTLDPMYPLISEECGVLLDDNRYTIIGAEKVDGFEAVARGEKVNVKKVTPGIVKLCKDAIEQYKNVRAFLFECTELPPYSDAVRKATGLPVYDAITNCDFFIDGFRDNDKFGLNGWQKVWDKEQEKYVFGQELSESARARLQTK